MHRPIYPLFAFALTATGSTAFADITDTYAAGTFPFEVDPEPSTASLLLGGSLSLTFRRLRQSRV